MKSKSGGKLLSRIKKHAKGQSLHLQVRRYVRYFWIFFAVTWGLILFLFVLVSMGLLGYMPSFRELENPRSNLASEIYTADNVLLGKYYIENRTNIHFEKISPVTVKALLATEDIRFYRHSGIDFKAFARVMYGVISGKAKGGGSTISQQMAKLLYHGRSSSTLNRVKQKLNEWIIAVKLERRYSKEEIIAMYLNKFDYINNAVGIESAARIYFDRSPDSLNLEQSALLIGMMKNPAFYNPVRRPDIAQERRNVVLGQMYKYGFITREELQETREKKVDMSHFRQQDHVTGLATYFREVLRSELKTWCSKHFKPDGTPYDIYRDGLRIYTTIHSKMQKYAETAVELHLKNDLQPAFFKHWKYQPNAPFYFANNPEQEIQNLMHQAVVRSDRYRKLKQAGASQDEIEKSFKTPVKMRVFSWKGERDTILSPMDSIRYSKYFLQAGLMSVETSTGYVRAYVGGINYKYFQYDHVSQGRRQVGSTFKPFLYTLAMQNGLSPCSKIPNIQPVIYLDDGRTWEPGNSDDKDIGREITLKYALATSNNWISGHLVKRFSPLAIVKIAQKMGVTSPLDPVPSIVLGSSDISPYEMVGAMSTFANKGIYIRPIFMTRIEDNYGNILETFVPEQHEAMDEETAYLMLDLMKGVVEFGTGVRLRYKYGFTNPIAGKTGTTNNYSDGWFMGITPGLTTGVWVGCEDRAAHFRSMQLGQGANMALPIWAMYMTNVYLDRSLNISMEDFEKPLNPLSVEIDCDRFERQKRRNWSDQDDF